MIPESEIFARLTALHGTLVEKLGAQPYLAPTIVMDGDSCVIRIYGQASLLSPLHRARSTTIDATLADAEAFVASMPDRDTKANADWHRKLGDVIDEGHALALPDAVMTPLRGASQAMTENLLTVETAE